VRVNQVTRHNHVWRIRHRLQDKETTYYLKCYTKDWYGDDVPRTEYCVRHERDTYMLLARHGLPTVEVASAGDAIFDLVAFALEMAAFHPISTRWWEPFFAGYSTEPDFELFRLHMLTFGEESFKCFGAGRWPGTRQEILSRLLAAEKWEALFAT
jgi:hypothetical protein